MDQHTFPSDGSRAFTDGHEFDKVRRVRDEIEVWANAFVAEEAS